jgi:two-component system response regulator GlrR
MRPDLKTPGRDSLGGEGRKRRFSVEPIMTPEAERFRCAIVSAAEGGEAARGVDAALTLMGEVAVERHAAFAPDMATSRPDGVFFVAHGFSRERLLDQIEQTRSACPRAAILVGGAGLKAEDIMVLMSAGAYDYVSLPSPPDELVARVLRALGVVPACRLAAPVRPAGSRIRNFIYASDAFARLAGRLPTIAGCDANVLILGETGTGKEVCAQAVHYLSARSAQPWVAVNCGAIPVDLVENELFGHVKGAYTTAHTARAGLVREAEGGTLFLDDVDCLPLAAQAKLLRFLQEGEYRPVGSNAVMRADVRVIAASNCSLSVLATQGRFRQDLYFRLNVLNMSLPPLRERSEDIPVLALHFTQQFARQFKRAVSALSPSALRKLFAHEWPGNVRELRHVIERAVLMCGGPVLLAEDIEIDLGGAPAIDDPCFRTAKARVIENFERGYLEKLLAAHGGNVTHAAKAAQKDRRAFFELMRKHQLAPERYRSLSA